MVSKVAELFDLGTDARVVGDPERGEMGRIWPVVTDRGRWAVKSPFDAQSEDEERPSADFADLVRGNGVVTPEMVRDRDGRLLASVDGHQFRVYSWLDMASADPDIDPALVGELVGRLHATRVVRDDEPVHPWYVEPVGVERWQQLADDLTATGCAGGLQLTAYVAELGELEAMIEAPRNLQVCHRDLWADNVRLLTTGGVCVFDWDDAGSCGPSHELGAVLFEYTRGDPHRTRALVAAYRDAGGRAEVEGRGTFTMAIAQLGHIGERAGRMWLDAKSPAERERAEANLAEFLDAALTVETIDLLVEAAQYAQRN